MPTAHTRLIDDLRADPGNADLRKELVERFDDLLAALREMKNSHGMHGPCEGNSCRSCDAAYKLARAAIAKADGTQGGA